MYNALFCIIVLRFHTGLVGTHYMYLVPTYPIAGLWAIIVAQGSQILNKCSTVYILHVSIRHMYIVYIIYYI